MIPCAGIANSQHYGLMWPVGLLIYDVAASELIRDEKSISSRFVCGLPRAESQDTSQQRQTWNPSAVLKFPLVQISDYFSSFRWKAINCKMLWCHCTPANSSQKHFSNSVPQKHGQFSRPTFHIKPLQRLIEQMTYCRRWCQLLLWNVILHDVNEDVAMTSRKQHHVFSTS